MPASNWEQKKKHALDLLQRLLNIWQGREPLSRIDAIGPQANNAVLMLELPDVDLPLPYDAEKMSGTSLAAILGAKDRSGGPSDEASKNINAWIQLIEKAEFQSVIEKKTALDDLENPIKCTQVAEIVREMSHNIAAKLKRRDYPVVKSARKNYCEVKHAMILWPQKREIFKKYLHNEEK